MTIEMKMPDNSEVRFLGDLQRLEVGPSDKFVLTVPDHLSMQACEALHKRWKEFFPDGKAPPLLILADGFRLGAISLSESKE